MNSSYVVGLGLCFFGAFVVGYLIALNGPEEAPGAGISVPTLIVRGVIFSFGVNVFLWGVLTCLSIS